MLRPITEEDFLRIEQLLLPAGQQFDLQRRDIIRCIESVDINACPGSGKTTTMLAKLLLLTDQMPLNSNKGICVLTHTNVAINELKDELNLSDTKLFKYPNHFGTIQSFINKFFAIPGYSAKFPGKRPSIIDQDWYNDIVSKRYAGWNGAGKFWIRNQNDPVALLQSYKLNTSFDNILKEINGQPVFQNNGAAALDIINFKLRIMREGILSFDDAYILAEYYLTNFPSIKKLIAQRFPLVIIDEMQDTDLHQLSILNKIFDPATTIVQRIGDYNQAIFNKVTNQSVWAISANTLPLNGSKRFSQQIADQIDRICLTPRNMTGNPEIPNLQPRILLFSQANVSQVLSRFSDIVIELGVSDLSNAPCKAVGWVKETAVVANQVRNCIRAYWPEFRTVNKAIKEEFNNLGEFFFKADDITINLKGTGYYWNKIVLVLLKILRLAQIRTSKDSFYSKTSLIKKLETHALFYDSLRNSMVGWIRKIHNNSFLIQEVRDFITLNFYPLFNIVPSQEINDFLNNNQVAGQPAPVILPDNGNFYKHSYVGGDAQHDGKQIAVHVSTIHGVKGETHAATLYLETFYYASDIRRIINYLKIGAGAAIPATQVRIIETLKMAYVAMSRPTHFLCLAMSNEGILPADIAELQAAGWFVDATLCN